MDGTIHYHAIEEAIRDLRDGKMVIVVDDEDRENEGDLTMAAEKVTPEERVFFTTSQSFSNDWRGVLLGEEAQH